MEIPKTIDKKLLLSITAVLILFGIMWRLSPHTPNFAPIGAIALVGGMALGWRTSLLTVLTVMMISDLAIGTYSSMYWTWLGFGLIAGYGFLIRKLPPIWRLPVGVLGTSGLFFIVSNFGTWISSGMYSHDLTGLAQCYVMALPFLKATILSDLVFAAVFLAVYEAVLQYKASRSSLRTAAQYTQAAALSYIK